MSKKEEMLPVDLGHLEDKAMAVVKYFEASHDPDRSEAYRKHALKQAESVAQTLVADFRYYFDTKLIGGIEPYGLSNQTEDTND